MPHDVGVAIERWITELEQRVDKAADLVKSLAFMRFNSAPGYMKKFEELALTRASGMSQPAEWNTAARKAGYWIEEYATYMTTPPKPNPQPGELGWAYQIASGRTRPDIELYWNFGGSGVQRVGWVDLTSSAQAGHIDKKSSTLWRSGAIGYVGEVIYDSIDFLGLGARIDALKGDISKVVAPNADLSSALAAYNRVKVQARAAQQEWWSVLLPLGRAVLDDPTITTTKRKNAMRWAIYYLLLPEQQAQPEDWRPKDAAAVLLAAGIPPANYGWPTKAGTTGQQGLLWLATHGITKAPNADDTDIDEAVRRAKDHLGIPDYMNVAPEEDVAGEKSDEMIIA